MTESEKERREGDERFGLTVLVVLGWILPLAGIAWGPGAWWAYALWLVIGTAAVVVFERGMSPSDGS